MKEDGAKEMTLDEWKAMQDKERAKVEFNIRKANEGADWNKGFVLHKSKADVSRNYSSDLNLSCRLELPVLGRLFVSAQTTFLSFQNGFSTNVLIGIKQ